MDDAITETKASIDRSASVEQQYRARESEWNSALLGEQRKWDEASDLLQWIERALSQPVQ